MCAWKTQLFKHHLISLRRRGQTESHKSLRTRLFRQCRLRRRKIDAEPELCVLTDMWDDINSKNMSFTSLFSVINLIQSAHSNTSATKSGYRLMTRSSYISIARCN